MPEATKSRVESGESIKDDRQVTSEASQGTQENCAVTPDPGDASGVRLPRAPERMGSGDESDEVDNPSPS